VQEATALCADVCVADDNASALQQGRANGPHGSSKIVQHVTAPSANDIRSLRDMKTTKFDGSKSKASPAADGRSTNLLTARGAVGGSNEDLLNTSKQNQRGATKAGPQPSTTGLSTLSSSNDTQSKPKKHGPTENLPEKSNAGFRDAAGHVHPSGKATEDRGPGSGDRKTGGQTTGMKRFGSAENLLSSTAAGSTASPPPGNERQRLLSEDLPPPPSPSTFIAIQSSSSAATGNPGAAPMTTAAAANARVSTQVCTLHTI